MNGITHWYGLIEPSLMRMMSAMAFHVEPMGPLVNYHGMRQPCFCNLSKVLAEVKRERPSFWEVLTDGGRLRSRVLKIAGMPNRPRPTGHAVVTIRGPRHSRALLPANPAWHDIAG